MRTAGEYKRLFEQIPDDLPVIIGDNWNCDIVSFSYSTIDGIVRLRLTEGCTITTNEFLDGLYTSFKRQLNEAYDEIGKQREL